MIEMNPLKEYIIEEDISLIYELSNDFEGDIPKSFLRLAESTNNDGKKRDCYGIVLKEGEKMVYRAAFTELFSGEGLSLGILVMTIPKGNYHSILIEDWNQKIMQIGPTFDQILKSGKVDTMSPCIEYYKTERELVCMVKSLE